MADCPSQWIRHDRKDHCRHHWREFAEAGVSVVSWFPELPSGSDFWGFMARSFFDLIDVNGVWQTPQEAAKKVDTDTPPPPKRIPSSRLLQMAGGGPIPRALASLITTRQLPPNVTSALSGESLAISPWDQPHYYEGYEECLREMAHGYGLKLWHSMSCGDGPFRPQHVREEHMRRIAEIHHRVGLEHIAGVTINEPPNIGFGFDDAVRTMDAYRHATGGQVMTWGGAPCTEVFEDIRRFARNATGWEEHSARGPGFETQAHHPWSLLREQRLHDLIAWFGALSENTGPGDPVSVGQQNHPEAVAMLRAIEAACKSFAFLFCGKGLFSRWHGPSFRDVPGWLSAIRAVHALEDFTNFRLHTYRKLTHTGAGDRFMTAVQWQPGMRFVQFGSEEDRKAVGFLFGENMGTQVTSQRGGQMRVLHPLTTDITPINNGDWVDFEYGRIILLEW